MKKQPTRISLRFTNGVLPGILPRLSLQKPCFLLVIILLSFQATNARHQNSKRIGKPISIITVKSPSLGSCPVPGIPVAIYGPTNACSYIGQPTNAVYYIDPVANATSYTWTIPANATLVSGQGTTRITVNFQSGFNSGSLKVAANSSCGTRAPRTLTITKMIPSAPTVITGESDACSYIGTGIPVSYSIQPVPNATSYTWTVPANVSILSGQGTTDITVKFTSGYTTSLIKVKSVATCGTSGDRTLSVFAATASQPGLISGSINVCPFLVSASNPAGIPVTYSISKVSSAKSYLWTAPADASIIDHPAGTGVNDTVVKVVYSSVFSSGIIKVAGVNDCGIGSLRALGVWRSTTGAPSNIDIIQIASCPNRVYSYTLATMPPNATGILWTVPANATLVSGQGTESITVSYPSTSILGSLTVLPYNNCSSGSMKSVNIKLPECPPIESSRKTQLQPTKLVVGDGDAIHVKVFSNPTVNDFKMQVITVGKEPINIRVLDMFGNEVKSFVSKPQEIIFFGNDFKPGNYLMEVRQGQNKLTQQLVKF